MPRIANEYKGGSNFEKVNDSTNSASSSSLPEPQTLPSTPLDNSIKSLPPELFSLIGDFCAGAAYRDLRSICQKTWQALPPRLLPISYLARKRRAIGRELQTRYAARGGLPKITISEAAEFADLLQYLQREPSLAVRHLSLSYFSDELLSLSQKITNLVYLQVIVSEFLSWTDLSGSLSFADLWRLLAKFPHLKQLEVKLYNRTSKVPPTAPGAETSRALKSLEELKVCDFSLWSHEEDAYGHNSNLVALLLGCEDLKKLTLHLHYLSSHSFAVLAWAKTGLANLEELEIKRLDTIRDTIDEYGNDCLEAARDFLRSLPKLKKLKLDLQFKQLVFLLRGNYFPKLQIDNKISHHIQHTRKLRFLADGSIALENETRSTHRLTIEELSGLAPYLQKVKELKLYSMSKHNFATLSQDISLRSILQNSEKVTLENPVITSAWLNKVLPYLPNLTTLYLTADTYNISLASLSPATLQALAKLTNIELFGDHCLADEKLLKALNILRSSCKNLKALTLRISNIENETSWQLLRQNNSDLTKQLEHLHLCTNKPLELPFILTVFRDCPKLTCLKADIAPCELVLLDALGYSALIDQIAGAKEHLQNTTSIVLSKKKLTTATLKSMFLKCPNLEDVDLSNSTGFADIDWVDLVKFIVDNALHRRLNGLKIKSLNLADNHIPAEALAGLMPYLIKLQKLNLSSCKNLDFATLLRRHSTQHVFRQLRILDLSYLRQLINIPQLKSLLALCDNLQSLYLKDWSDEDLIHILLTSNIRWEALATEFYSRPIAKLKIDYEVTNLDNFKLLLAAHSWDYLEIYPASKLGLTTLLTDKEILSFLINVERLSLASMQITTADLQSLLKIKNRKRYSFRWLEKLDLSGCHKIDWPKVNLDDDVLDSESTLQTLTELDLSYNHIPYEVLIKLLPKCTNLQQLYLRDWQDRFLQADKDGQLKLTYLGLFTPETLPDRPQTLLIGTPAKPHSITVHYSSTKAPKWRLFLNSLSHLATGCLAVLSYLKFLWPPSWLRK